MSSGVLGFPPSVRRPASTDQPPARESPRRQQEEPEAAGEPRRL